MDDILTFGGEFVKSLIPKDIEIHYGIKLSLDRNEKIPLIFPKINQSSCSCDKCITISTIENFKIIEPNETDQCIICREKQCDKCSKCAEESKADKCIVIESLSCDHRFHFCCIIKWLSTKTICPICAKDWKFLNINESKFIVYHNDKIEEFEISENLMSQLEAKFNLDMTKYKLTKHKVYIDEYKNGKYALCTPDMHPGFNALTIYCKMESRVEKIFMKYSTSINELRDEVSRIFNIFKDQVKMTYNGTEIVKDFDNLNIYNLDIEVDSEIIVECQISNEYTMEIDNNFMILYPNCGISGNNITSNNIQNFIYGKVSWVPFPFIKDTTKQELSCLLSSLYILVKKVNIDNNLITFVINKFEKYMAIYEINVIQIQLAKTSLESLLRMTKFEDKDRMILSCTFHELIFKMQKESGIEKLKNPLLSSNLLCGLLLSLNPAEKVNWKYAIKDTQIEKTFNIYSALVLVNATPPLLTLNENMHIVVFTGKGKNVSLPIILYNPLTDNETDVNAAELGKKVSVKGEMLIIDDRIYDEGIMVCIDTSNSMGNCSDFHEDILAKEKNYKEAKKQFYEILSIKKVIIPEDSDIRKLQNTVIWFITHPNFNDWTMSYNLDVIKSIICLEQEDNLEKAEIISKYISIFDKLLKNKKVQIGGCYYSHTKSKKEKETEINYKNEPLLEYMCPISQEVMNDPVLAQDGFTYERKQIEQWFKNHSNSPLTRENISSTLLENKTLKTIIEDWKETNTILPQIEGNTIIIKILEPLKTIIFKYNDFNNVWDLIYKIYNITGYTYDEYTLKTPMRTLGKDDLIKNINTEIELHLNKKNMVTIKIFEGFSEISTELFKPDTYSIKNIIYAFNKYDYHKCEIWKDLKSCGDGGFKGQIVPHSSMLWSHLDYSFRFFKGKKLTTTKNYLTRLDVVKKLFDAFINRSIAYSFNTAIGLMSFSDKSKLECEMTPFYESFRDKMDELDTNGETALYESLNDAIGKLVIWREADLEKRKNAKLRIICLSDGKDSGLVNIKYQIASLLTKHSIKLDFIAIGQDYETHLGDISKKTGGYMFNPSTIKYAFNIMELETMIISNNRGKITTYNGLINETTLPPILNPDKSLNAKSSGIEKTLEKFGCIEKILHKQLIEIMKNPHPYIDIYINDNDIYFWKIIISGPSDSVYQKGTWLAYIQFPSTYPQICPNIRFVTPIKNCNVNSYGKICHSILDRNYTPSVKISLILECIYGLLLNPEVSDPLDTNLAMLYYEANGQYEAEIMKHVNKYALKSREQWKKELV